MSKEKAKKVRPRAAGRLPLSVRVTPLVRNGLVEAAHDMGRSVSQEAETRLERSFYFEGLLPEVVRLAYGDRIGGLLLAIGDAMKEAVRRSPEDVDNPWYESPWNFAQVAESVSEIMQLAKPDGEVTAPPNDHTGVPDFLYEARVKFGKPSARYKAKDVITPPEMDPSAVRHGAAVREMLGPKLIGRIASRVNPEKQS